MANKVLGRDLGDLLSRAQPARLLDRAAAKAGQLPSSTPASKAVESAPAEASSSIDVPKFEPAPDPTSTILRPPPRPGQGFSMTSGSFAFFVCDLLFLGLAVYLSQSGWFTVATGIGLAVLAVLLGAVCGCLGVLLMAVAGARGDENQPGAKIRVQLKR